MATGNLGKFSPMNKLNSELSKLPPSYLFYYRNNLKCFGIRILGSWFSLKEKVIKDVVSFSEFII